MDKIIKWGLGITIVGVFLLIIEIELCHNEIDKLKEENALISSNLTYTLEQLKQTHLALEEKEIQYNKIERESESLNKKLQEIEENADEEEKNWLEGIIPSSIDDTIPY